MQDNARPLILGSSSLYRRELLGRLGIPFEVHSPDIDERARDGETPRELAMRLASEKADAIARRFPRALIIGSDQVAHDGPTIFGKPGSHPRAVEQLQRMSGKTVVFESALCLLDGTGGQRQIDSVVTEIVFRELSPREIESYLRRDEPYGCAGSARLESLGIALIKRMRSDDPTAIIGLPLVRLCEMLRAAGVDVV